MAIGRSAPVPDDRLHWVSNPIGNLTYAAEKTGLGNDSGEKD